MAQPNYRQLARQKAKTYGLDPNIFVRQIQQESGFNPNAVSPAGARGIAQIMPATAKGWGVDPSDPVASLDAAAKNMAAYVKKYGGYRNALVAYNAGPGRVGGPLPAETQNYIKTILGGSAPRNTPASPGATYNSQLISNQISQPDNRALMLSLLGFGGSDYGSPDPLTMALTAALQKGSTGSSSRGTTPSAPQSSPQVGSGKNPGLYHLAKVAQDKFGLTIREFAPFDKVDPVHTKGSYHYSNRAFDASGSPQKMKAFDEYVSSKYGRWVKELFYDRGKNLKNGKPTTPIGGHGDHVHVAE